MLEFAGEFWRFLRKRKKFWIAPILVLMVLLAAAVAFVQGSAVAPFIYTIF